MAGAAFSLPSYPVVIPDRIEAVQGAPVKLPIVLWNLRSKPISITYLGDCCSLPKEQIVPAFSSIRLDVELDTSNLPVKEISKAASLQYKLDGRTFIQTYPYIVKVSGR